MTSCESPLTIKRLVIKGDSQLVMKQVNKEYVCPQMAPYVEEVWKLQRRFSALKFVYVPPGRELCRRLAVQDGI